MFGTIGRSSSSACVLIVPILIIMHVYSIEAHPQRRYTEEEICYETRKTFETVKKCPEHHSVIIQRSQMKNCSKYPMCHDKQLIYHCFGYNESFVEVCAPISRIVGNFCVLFDYGVGRILPDYNKPCPECPSIYSSNESSTYLSCVAPILSTSTTKTVFDSTSDLAKSNNLKEKPAKGHNIRLISNLPERTNSARLTSEPLVTSTRFMIPGNDTIHTRENSSDSAEMYIIIIGSIFIMIVVGFVLYKIKTRSSEQSSFKQESISLPLTNSHSEPGESRDILTDDQHTLVTQCHTHGDKQPLLVKRLPQI
ncbi:uncharacterized protein LOC128169472 [Crassostrea angulata]|uniref:uncharacterized protein LOC128169472 n=1 Tax=Magallana angulata TaxID=2784310 RepID=UPI0022B18B1D|nr:uncharacterized protein LOC128169472 [Crassostrea angulata]